MLATRDPIPLRTLIAAVALALAGTGVQAESACKGLEMAACEKAAECTWVESYARQDGIKVAGYCRTKSSQGATKAPPSGDVKRPAQEATKMPPAQQATKTPAQESVKTPAQEDPQKATDQAKPKDSKKKAKEETQ